VSLSYDAVPQQATQQVQTKDELEQLKWALRKKCQESLYFFSKTCLCYPDLTPHFHRELTKWLTAAPFKGARYLIEIFRGGLKTSIVTVAWNIHEMIQYQLRTDGVVEPLKGHFGPLVRIVFVGGSQQNISKFLVHRVQPKFEPGEKYKLFHWLFPEIIPTNYRDEVWNSLCLTIPRPYDPEGPTIDTLGVGSKIEGKRANRVIEDDVFGKDAADSAIIAKNIIDYHQLIEPIAEDTMRDEIATVGNRWAYGDLNGWIRENEEITRHFHKAVVECRCHPDGPPCDAAEPVWPERFGWDAIKRLKKKLGPYKFSCQYLNAPHDPENKPFELANLRYYEWEGEPGVDGTLVIAMGRGKKHHRIKVRDLYRIGAIDPAGGSKHTSDRSAMVCVGTDHKTRIFLLDAYAKKIKPFQFSLDILDFYKRWELGVFGVEEVAFQVALRDFMESHLCDHKQIWPYFKKLKTSTRVSKDARIANIIGQRTGAGQVYIHNNMTNFIQEYTWYPDETYPRDLLDAFSYCSQLWSFMTEPGGTLKEYEQAQYERRRTALGDRAY
jgi:hypothetical protein